MTKTCIRCKREFEGEGTICDKCRKEINNKLIREEQQKDGNWHFWNLKGFALFMLKLGLIWGFVIALTLILG